MAYLPQPNGGRINLSVSGGSVQSTGTVVLSAGNNVTLSQNGNTISINAAGAPLLRWEYPQQVFTSLNSVVSNGALSVQHMYVPFNVQGSAMKIGGSVQASVSSNGSQRTAGMSLWMGIYTLNGSTLQTVSTASANNSFAYNAATASSSQNSSVTGMREFTVPMNISMPRGEYWVAAVMSTTTGPSQNWSFNMYGNNQIASGGGAGNANLSPIGGNTASGRDVILFQGVHTSIGYTMPNSIVSADLNISAASNVQKANFYNAIYSAIY